MCSEIRREYVFAQIDHPCFCQQMVEDEEKKKLARREELEQIHLRKAADEVFRRNEMEKNDRRSTENEKRTQFLFAQMVSEETVVECVLCTINNAPLV